MGSDYGDEEKNLKQVLIFASNRGMLLMCAAENKRLAQQMMLGVPKKDVALKNYTFTHFITLTLLRPS